jgi:aspartyl-tRNA synthetase
MRTRGLTGCTASSTSSTWRWHSSRTAKKSVRPWNRSIKQLVTDFAGKKLLSEEFRAFPYQEAMEKYGSDKPDLRYGMELIELSDILEQSEFGVFAGAIKDGGCVKAICVEGAAHSAAHRSTSSLRLPSQKVPAAWPT